MTTRELFKHERALDVEHLRAEILYVPETGEFFRLKFRGNQLSKPIKAGHLNPRGYYVVWIGGRKGCGHLAHRLAWFYMTGSWPEYTIDHINGEFSDNRWDNLRDVPMSINKQNMRKARSDNKTGLLGVRRQRGCKTFAASISIKGKRTWLGSYRTAELAHQAYLKAKREFHEGATI